MATLKDKLLDGKVIGEKFRSPNSSDPYKVIDLHYQGVPGEFACLVTKESDGKEHHYNLATRLGDRFIESTQTSSQQSALENLTPEQIELIASRGGCHHQFN